jgi:hypothetical protein
MHDAPLSNYITQLVLVIALTPLIPLSLKGEGEDNKKEGLPPLLNTLWLLFGGELKRGEASLIKLIPPPLSKGGGYRGWVARKY